jgi:hypothetical protein
MREKIYAKKAISCRGLTQGVMKAYSMDKETWYFKRETFIAKFKEKHGVNALEPLLGIPYYECFQKLVSTEELFGIDEIVNYFNSSAFHAGLGPEDYVQLDEESEQELKRILISFLDARNPVKHYMALDIQERLLTEEFGE